MRLNAKSQKRLFIFTLPGSLMTGVLYVQSKIALAILYPWATCGQRHMKKGLSQVTDF
jgi:hypothetical protein